MSAGHFLEDRDDLLVETAQRILAQTCQCVRQFWRADEAEGDEVAVESSDRCRGRGLFAVSMNDDLATLGQVDFQGVQGHGNDLVKTIREAVEVVFSGD